MRREAFKTTTVAEENQHQNFQRQLKHMGADIEEHPDGLTIRGGRPLKGAQLDSETDHRVAMSLAVAALMAKGDSTLAQSDAAAVSYPTFWNDLERLQR